MCPLPTTPRRDRKSTRLNSSHLVISYAVFCLKKKKQNQPKPAWGTRVPREHAQVLPARRAARAAATLPVTRSMRCYVPSFFFFFFNAAAPPEIYPFPPHAALPI